MPDPYDTVFNDWMREIKARTDATATKVRVPAKRTISAQPAKSRLPAVHELTAGESLRNLALSFAPAVGEGMSAGEAVNDAREGHWGSAALNTAMAVPVAGKGVKAGVRVLSALRKGGKVAEGLEPVARGIKAWHGSPHKFDAFDLAKIGTGEGGSSFGHGVNLASDRAEAEAYRRAGAGRVDRTGSGYLYEAEIDASPDELLDWDRPLSKQPAVVQAASHDVRDLPLPDSFSIDGGTVAKAADGTWRLDAGGGSSFRLTQSDVERLYGSGSDPRGSGIYGRLRDKYGSKGASDSLRARGVVGLRYIDQQASVPGSSSFTIFDPAKVRVVARSNKPKGKTK